jgi:hypothetical protein
VNYDAARNNPYVQRAKALLRSNDPKVKEMVARANAALVQKALTPGSVHVDTTLANLSIQYKNAEYIGTQLMPIVTVAHLSDRYFVYDKRSRLAYPDDALGARASANELNENLTTDNFSCKPYGYKEYVDNLTLKNQTAPLDEMVDVIANLNEGIDFREELRIASILTTAGNFGSNTTTLGSSAYWTVAATSSPVTDIQNAAAALWMGRGATRLVGYTSLNVWNALVRNPSILDLFKYTRPGLAQKAEIAAVLGLDDILVSSARKDTANEAQAASYSRIWGDVFGIVRVASSPGIRTAGFGYTFRFGQKDTNEWFDPTVGPLGGFYGRVSVVEDHKVVAADTGFLITNPIG